LIKIRKPKLKLRKEFPDRMEIEGVLNILILDGIEAFLVLYSN